MSDETFFITVGMAVGVVLTTAFFFVVELNAQREFWKKAYCSEASSVPVGVDCGAS